MLGTELQIYVLFFGVLGSICTEMFILAKMMQLLSNKITPYFQRLPMSKNPITLDSDSATIQNFGQMYTNRIRNGKSAAEAPRS